MKTLRGMALRYSVINKDFKSTIIQCTLICHKHKSFPFYMHIFNDTEQVIYNSYVCIKSLYITLVIDKIK